MLALAGAAALAVAALGHPRLAVGCALLVLGSSAVGAARLEAVDPPPLRPAAGGRIESLAILLEHPRPARFGSAAAVRIRAGPMVLARSSSGVHWPRGAAPGSELVAAAPPRRSALEAGSRSRLAARVAPSRHLGGAHA